MKNLTDIESAHILTMNIHGVNDVPVEEILKNEILLAHALKFPTFFKKVFDTKSVKVKPSLLENSFSYMINKGLFTKDFYLSLPPKYQKDFEILDSLFHFNSYCTNWISEIDLTTVKFSKKTVELILKFDVDIYLKLFYKTNPITVPDIISQCLPTYHNFNALINHLSDELYKSSNLEFITSLKPELINYFTDNIFMNIYNNNLDTFNHILSFYKTREMVLPTIFYKDPKIFLQFQDLLDFFYLETENQNNNTFNIIFKNFLKMSNPIIFNIESISFGYSVDNLSLDNKAMFLKLQNLSHIQEDLFSLSEISNFDDFLNSIKKIIPKNTLNPSLIWMFLPSEVKNNEDFLNNFLNLDNSFTPMDISKEYDKEIFPVIHVANKDLLTDSMIQKLMDKNIYNTIYLLTQFKESPNIYMEKIIFILNYHIEKNNNDTLISSHNNISIPQILQHCDFYQNALNSLDFTLKDVINNDCNFKLSIEALNLLYDEDLMKKDIKCSNSILKSKVHKF